MKGVLVVFFIFCFVCDENVKEIRDLSVLFVPGLAGSRLYIKKGCEDKKKEKHKEKEKECRETLWVDGVKNVVNSTFIMNLVIDFDKNSKTFKNYSNAEIVTDEMGEFEGVGVLDESFPQYTMVHKILREAITNSSNEKMFLKKENTYGAPYDFRTVSLRDSIMKDFFEKLTDFVEEKKNETKNKFVIVCHSMGCPLIARFLQMRTKNWREGHIKGVFTINGAFKGPVYTLNSLLMGGGFPGAEYVTSNEKLKEILKNAPVFYTLLPRPIFNGNYSATDKKVICTLDEKEYFEKDMKQLLVDAGIADGAEIYSATQSLETSFPEGLRIHSIISKGQSTIDSFAMVKNKGNVEVKEKHVVDGDGVLPVRILEHIYNLVPDDSKELLTVTSLNISNHYEILFEKEVGNELMKFIEEVNG